MRTATKVGPILPLLLLIGHVGVSCAGVVRGVAPEEQAKFVAEGTFKCADGSGAALSMSCVNDEFCDCSDGSDEPGTGACSGQEATMFYCENAGSVPMQIYSSRVDDGICDCCDGSDEAGLVARMKRSACQNDCKEQGERGRQERAQKTDILKQGLAAQEEIVAKAKEGRAKQLQELAALKSELPSLEAALEEAKKVKEAADLIKAEEEAAAAAAAAKEAGEGGDCSEQLAKLTETVKRQQDEISKLQAEVKALKGDEADALPESVMSDVLQTGKPKVEKKKVVSEYTKWMDGAEEAEGAGEEDDSNDVVEEDAGAADASEAPTATNDAAAEVKAPDPTEVPQAKVKENKDRASKIETELGQLPEDKLGYASLIGNTIKKRFTEYEYKLSFFDKASQDHVTLGKFNKWTGPRSVNFNDGQHCYGGPSREINVKFECGTTEELLDISEPSRCIYAATVSHPGACEAADFEALAAPKVIRPRDEL